MPGPEDFAWFEDPGFAGYLQSLRILFARDRSWQKMLASFGLDPSAARGETLEAQVEHPDRPTVRAGEHGEWGYTVETVICDTSDLLERLSIDEEAFELVYTPMTCPFRYAAGGTFVSGFDMTVPTIRWGDEQRFETEIVEAGFLDPLAVRALRGPRFIQLAFGVTITQEMVEGPLRSVVRPAA